jgi:uncharacterized protein YcfL
MRILLITISLIIATGCSTLTQGPLQRIEVVSEPAGATVEAADCGTRIAPQQTPATVTVRRQARRCEITVSHQGYWKQSVQLTRKVSESVEWNLLALEAACSDCGSASVVLTAAALGVAAAGLLIDAGSGAMYELEPARLFVRLEPLDQPWREGIEDPLDADEPDADEESGSRH